MSDTPVFNKVAILGMGLIGSSIARALKKHGLAGSIVGGDGNQAVCDRAVQIGLAEAMTTDMAAAVAGADLVVMAVPVGACGAVASSMAPGLAPGAIVTDVGSVKAAIAGSICFWMKGKA
mgnify:CR=1 FL=1